MLCGRHNNDHYCENIISLLASFRNHTHWSALVVVLSRTILCCPCLGCVCRLVVQVACRMYSLHVMMLLMSSGHLPGHLLLLIVVVLLPLPPHLSRVDSTQASLFSSITIGDWQTFSLVHFYFFLALTATRTVTVTNSSYPNFITCRYINLQ